jgi:choline kinase
MKVIILSAGQGSRLLPLTEDRPKCLLDVGGDTILGVQLKALKAGGASDVVIVTGFRTAAVEAAAAAATVDGFRVRTLFNPFYNVADNLGSCWMARGEMEGPFLLLNGDTLFEPAIFTRLLAAPEAPITLTIDKKSEYDSDDMKVKLDGARLLDVGKVLTPEDTDGESIGFSRFSKEGAAAFVETLDQTMRTPNGLSWWYLKAIAVLGERGLVQTCSIEGLKWGEVDFLQDLEVAATLFGA